MLNSQRVILWNMLQFLHLVGLSSTVTQTMARLAGACQYLSKIIKGRSWIRPDLCRACAYCTALKELAWKSVGGKNANRELKAAWSFDSRKVCQSCKISRHSLPEAFALKVCPDRARSST